jgi:hypothetical protein
LPPENKLPDSRRALQIQRVTCAIRSATRAIRLCVTRIKDRSLAQRDIDSSLKVSSILEARLFLEVIGRSARELLGRKFLTLPIASTGFQKALVRNGQI